MNRHATQMDDLQLIALPNAVSVAQMFVQFAVTEWSLRAMTEDATELAASLVRASVRAANPQQPGMITIRVQVDRESLVIEVEDPMALSSDPPGVPEGVHGGVQPRRGGGRVVWAELPLPTGMTGESVPLPKRERRPSPEAKRLADAGEPTGVDPEVIERIMTALSRSADRRGE